MVLAMFTETCPVPTQADIDDWCDDHPRHAEAIRELAADLLADEELGHGAPEPTPAELEADRRMVADMAARITGRRPSSVTMAELIAEAGAGLPRLAEQIGLDRAVLADIEEGAVALPIGRKIARALADALKKPISLVQDAIVNSALTPRMGYAKAEGTPSSAQIPYRQAILESGMSDERKTFWLDD